MRNTWFMPEKPVLQLEYKQLVGTHRIATENIKFSDGMGAHVIPKSGQVWIDSIQENPNGNLASVHWGQEIDTQSPVGELYREATMTGVIPIKLLLEYSAVDTHNFKELKEELESLLNKKRAIYEDDLKRAIQLAHEWINELKKSHGTTIKRRTIVSPNNVGVENSMRLTIPLSNQEREELLRIKILLEKLTRPIQSTQLENIRSIILDLMVL